MWVLKNISSLIDLERYIDHLRTLNPDCSDQKEFLMLKDFMKFSPERFAREIGKNEIQFSKTINNIKGELNKKIRHVIRIEKMNSVLPDIGEVIYNDRNKGFIKSQRTYCVCIKDTVFNSVYPKKFFRGVVYSYFVYNGKYHVFHRDKPGNIRYGTSQWECDENHFVHHFENFREWKINQIMYSSSGFD